MRLNTHFNVGLKLMIVFAVFLLLTNLLNLVSRFFFYYPFNIKYLEGYDSNVISTGATRVSHTTLALWLTLHVALYCLCCLDLRVNP